MRPAFPGSPEPRHAGLGQRPTTRGILSLLTLLALLAPPSSASPGVSVAVGFDGIHRVGRPVHLRLEIENEGPAWSDSFLVVERFGDRDGLTWEFPLEIPAGARTVRWLTLVPTMPSLPGLEWTGLSGAWARDDSSRQELTYRLVGDGANVIVALTITDRATGYSGVREALVRQGQGHVEVQMPAVSPAELPPDPAAWEGVDLLVLDLAAADRLDAPTWRALAIRVAQGATLLVHGPGRLPELFPAELVPGTPPPGALSRPWSEPGTGVEHSALRLVPVPEGESVEWQGQELDWAASRRVGAGRVCVAGVDLRNLRSRIEEQAPLWAALLGVGASAPPSPSRSADRILPALLEHEAVRRGLPARAFKLLLLLLAVGAAAAWLAARALAKRPGFPRRLAGACALAALPLFLVGALSRSFEDERPFVVAEHLGALALTRTTTVIAPATGRTRLARLELPGWPVRVGREAGLQPAATIRAGDPALALDLRMPTHGGSVLEAERWEREAAPFRLERDEARGALVRNLSGRDLEQVHVLFGATILAAGELRDGEAAPWSSLEGADDTSVPYLALTQASSRLNGVGVAGLVRASDRGLFVRQADGVVTAWLESRP